MFNFLRKLTRNQLRSILLEQSLRVGSVILCLSTMGCFSEMKEPFSFHNGSHRTSRDSIDAKGEVKVDPPPAEVVCIEGSECPVSLGLMVSLSVESGKPRFRYCPASLVQTDILMMNQQCLPWDLQREGAETRGRLWVYFPGVGEYEKSRVEGLKVLSVFPRSLSNKNETIEPHFSLVQLQESPNRPHFEVSRKGFQDREEYKVAQVNVTNWDRGLAFIQTSTCTAILGSLISPLADHPYSSNMVLANCLVQEKHAGSPILDQDGKIRGIIYRPFEVQEVRRDLPVKEVAPLSSAINFACSDFPSSIVNENLSENCQSLKAFQAISYPNARTRQIEHFRSEIEENAQTQVDEVVNELDPSFKWRLVSTSLIFKTKADFYSKEDWVAFPECIKDVPTFTNLFRNWLQGYLTQAEYSLVLPQFRLTIELDRYLVHDYSFQRLENSTFDRLKFSPNTLVLRNQTRAELLKIPFYLTTCAASL